MPFSITWDSQDAIPEQLKTLVTEKDGKFVFEGETTSDVANLKGTLRKERDARTKHETELKRFERFKSFTEAEEEEVDQFIEAWTKRGEKKAEKQPDTDTAKQLELKDKLHAKEIKKRDDELLVLREKSDRSDRELREFRLWTPLREVAIKSGMIAEDWELARLDLTAQGRFGFDDDGRIVVLEDGQPSTVTPEKFFKEVYTDQRPKFYHATGAGGGGANASAKTNGNAKVMKRQAFEELTPQARMDYIKSGGTLAD